MIENKRQTMGQYKEMEQVYMVTQNQKRWKAILMSSKSIFKEMK
jgi:hypothetical protein